jgi:uncharacterized protein (TIGR00255 family)
LLLSMTGFGEARFQDQRWSIEVEVKTVNNRHLKLTAKISEPYSSLEPELERLVHENVRRGAVQINLRIERPRRAEDYKLNIVALTSYRDQLETLQGPDRRTIDLGVLLTLPGVVDELRPTGLAPHDDWPEIAAVVSQALANLETARAREGAAMAAELQRLSQLVSDHLTRITDRVPQVVQSYQKRLTERIRSLVQDQGVTIDSKDLIREIAILADRSDVSEEIVRLRAHLSQFEEIIHESESAGRKLEFLVQEMGREVNTIGSKAGDAEISRNVVEIKGVLEKIRELVQNVE